MDNLAFINEYLQETLDVKRKIANDNLLIQKISGVADVCCEAFARGNKVLIAGNGGSAADSQHIAAEFVSRFFYDRPGLPAVALTTDTSMLTAIGNDYGFENLFSRQVQALAQRGDIFLGLSTSGNSKNVINAVDQAKALGVYTVALCGQGGDLRKICDESISVPSECTPFIQEAHICIGHLICAIVEAKVFPRPDVNV